MDKQRFVRFALVAAATAAVSVPVVSKLLAAPVTVPPVSVATSAPSATQPATQPVAMDPSHVIIQIGDDKITVADFDSFISELPPQEQAMARGPGRRELAEYLVKMKLLANEATSRKLEDSPKFKRQLQMIREQVLANALATSVADSVDDAAVKKYFDEHKQQLERVAARHILIRTPDSKMPAAPGKPVLTEEQAKAKAEEIYKKLQGGADFATLARENSDDTGSAAEGGDLGSFTRGRMVAPFEQAAFALKEGQISAPIKTPFGWHIIQVTSRFDTPEKLADPIRKLLAPQKMSELVANLRKNGKVELDEKFLGPPLPEEPEMPGAGLPPDAPSPR